MDTRPQSPSVHTAVLLINLGSPEAPTAPAVRTYLKEFLSDPRVVEIPRALWWIILNGIILNTRPKKSAEKYASVWTPEGSPLKVHTEKQLDGLRAYFSTRRPDIRIEYAMRYGSPAIPDTLSRLHADGIQRVLVFPLYPQYASSTTGTALESVFKWANTQRAMPSISTINRFGEDPAYISALASTVHAHWAERPRGDKKYRLVMSFHGLPRRAVDAGDPYYVECLATGKALAQKLNLQEDEYCISFQSRFGRGEWLSPDTEGTLSQLARSGVERVDVICPGFISDCLETLEEIALEAKATFLNAGGREFHNIACLNSRPECIEVLGGLLEKALRAE